MHRVLNGPSGEPALLIEVTPVASDAAEHLGVLRGSRQPGPGSIEDLAEVGAVIAKVCQQVLDSVRTGLERVWPDELELKFGVSISGEAGLPLITKASGEASFEVKTKWLAHSPSETDR